MKVRVQNFQSLEDVKIDISGFTMLVGESSEGKSATFRALQAAVSNRFRVGQVRNGEDLCRVGIKFDDMTLVVEKPVSGSVSLVRDGVRYEKLGRTVPADIANVINMDLVVSDRDSCSLNFHPQFEEPFLLGFSQGKVVELLSASDALDDLNECKGGLLSRRSEVRGEISSLVSILDNVRGELSVVRQEVNDLGSVVNDLRHIQGDKQCCESRLQQVQQLYMYVEQLCLYVRQLQGLRCIISFLQESPDVLQCQLKQVVQLYRCIDYLNHLRQCSVGLGSLVERLVVMSDMQDRLQGIQNRYHLVDSLVSRIDALRVYKHRRGELEGFVNNRICPICGNVVNIVE